MVNRSISEPRPLEAEGRSSAASFWGDQPAANQESLVQLSTPLATYSSQTTTRHPPQVQVGPTLLK